MFLATTGYDITNRGIQEPFQDSGETVSQCFHKVLNALIVMYTHYIQLPLITYKSDTRISKDSKYGSYVGDYLGALDRIHILAYIPYVNQIPYQN